MMNFLKQIEGKVLVIHYLGEQLNLSAADGTILSVYNKYAFRSPAGFDVSPVEGEALMVVAIASSPQSITISFEDDAELIVDLSNDGYNGPEAMLFTNSIGETVVWN